jgi:hypothetical protein
MITLTKSLSRLERAVYGTRDWYRIDHCKRVINGEPYFHVQVCKWTGDRRRIYEAVDYSLARAINIVLFNIASPGTI